MAIEVKFGDTISIWDSNKDDKVQIGVGKWKEPSLVSMYGSNGVENYIFVTIIFVFESFE
jgi:hypothetical protein